uniref:Nuclease associated modular domain-containing protein n=1 Tax=viral metagenome TaxID=1070528 RepID=A0A6H1ZJQ3_9ZZZZ
MRDKLGRFVKGESSWNKGLKGWINSGSFKKGHKRGMTGKIHSQEAKEKIKKANTGYEHTEKAIEKMSVAKKGNKYSLGYKHTKEMIEKVSEEKAHNWKGDDVGCAGVHTWIRKHKGNPKICKHCGITSKNKRLHWANIDHKYLRKLDDYISLCVPCHIKYDVKYNNRNVGCKKRLGRVK